MPHVVFDKRINLEELFEKFSPIVQKEPCLVKITEMYIDNQKQKMLLPVVVIDQRHHDFLIEISTTNKKPRCACIQRLILKKQMVSNLHWDLLHHLLIKPFLD